ncbi:hypothetical protein HHI36_010704 [Cryptolaemus montrouzieri]|uniref:Uncharacterized protein n=1 Tax=Cryptolaemus montrouzieri TaxID=559131 RepID=A0ABD2MJH1_9CUCU
MPPPPQNPQDTSVYARMIEGKFEGDQIRDLIEHLTDISGRSLDVIKKKRQTQQWKNLVEGIKRIEQSIREDNKAERQNEVLGVEIDDLLREVIREPEIVEEDLIIPMVPEEHLRPVVHGRVHQFIIDLAPQLEDDNDIMLPAAVCIRAKYKEAIDWWVSKLIEDYGRRKHERQQPKQQQREQNASNRKKRARKYRETQEKWRNNKN